MNQFEEYVKRFADARGISVEDAKKHKVVREAEEYYKNHAVIERNIRLEVEATLCNIQK